MEQMAERDVAEALLALVRPQAHPDDLSVLVGFEILGEWEELAAACRVEGEFQGLRIPDVLVAA